MSQKVRPLYPLVAIDEIPVPNRLSAGSGRGAVPIRAYHEAFMIVARPRSPSLPHTQRRVRSN
jgi:hypothetical protein